MVSTSQHYLMAQTGITALSNADIQSQMHSDAQALINANYTVYSIADTDTLSNLTFIPPTSAVNADFSVKVITQRVWMQMPPWMNQTRPFHMKNDKL